MISLHEKSLRVWLANSNNSYLQNIIYAKLCLKIINKFSYGLIKKQFNISKNLKL